MAQSAQAWSIAHAAMTALIIIPLIVIWFLTIGLARRKGDPARAAFSWLKACHPFLVVSLLLIVVSDVATTILVSWQYDNGRYDSIGHSPSAIKGLTEVYQYCGIIGTWFERIVTALFVVVFVELGSGFRYAQMKKAPSNRSVFRGAALTGALIIFVLSTANFAVPLAALVAYYNGAMSSSGFENVKNASNTADALRVAVDVIAFVISLGQIIYATYVVRQHAGMPARQSAVIYLVATILDAIRFLLFVVFDATWVIPKQFAPYSWNAVDAILNTWLRFVILVLLLVIGNRRMNGIWSTVQHWMEGGHHHALHDQQPQQVMQSYGNIHPQQQPMYQQHQQYQPYPPQPQQHPGWQQPPPHAAQLDSWSRHELSSPQEVARPGELDSHQAYRQQYNPNGVQSGVGIPAENKA
ncbi:hypothetical protein QQS21_004337 [Conoideocrella luteorostrata]|uniref:Uncharacterized protein n=1 Tax=Conoideocrella luteorostrata TaxID=1105319 RepID=A0AAJ0FZW2_9HYPO|nr:hypothetical protein QQS21_004337 [Conoideocrella luteorostrata]